MSHMSPLDSCLAYAPLIALAVAVLKKLPWIGQAVARNAKLTASTLSLLSVATAMLPHTAGFGGVDWVAFGSCVVVQFAGAVATHEVVIAPAIAAVTAK